MKIYIDTADVNEVKTLVSYLPIAGVTTNPTIAAKSAGKMVSAAAIWLKTVWSE